MKKRVVKEKSTTNISDIVCWLIAGVIWAIGVIMCITGKLALPGVLLIVVAGFFCSPKRVSLVGAFLKEKRSIRKWRTVENVTIIILGVAATVLIIANLPTIKAKFGTGSSSSQTAQTEGGNTASGNQSTPNASDTDIAEAEQKYGKGIGGFFNALWDATLGGIKGDIEDLENSLGAGSSTEESTDVKATEETTEPEDITIEDIETVQESTGYIETDYTEYSGYEGLTIDFIDVGQGDCALITVDGEQMLVDCGYQEYGEQIVEYVRKQTNAIIPGNLKYFLCTHNDADHIGSADCIITNLSVGTLWMSDYPGDTYAYDLLVKDSVMAAGGAYKPSPGSSYSLGSATITILAPSNTHEDINDNSIVFRIDYPTDERNISALFAGDAEEEEELELLASGYDLSADILKVGHHGSKTSSSEEFISAVNPTYAVISCGMGNDYYHPHAAALNTLMAQGVKLRRTDEEGTVTVTVDTTGAIKWNCAEGTWNPGS